MAVLARQPSGTAEGRAPDVSHAGYQSFYLNRIVPVTNGQVRVQFVQDAASAGSATLAVWYQETGTLQRVSFTPGGVISPALLSEEPGIATFDLNGDQAPDMVLTVRPNQSFGVDFAADLRGRSILTMSANPPQPGFTGVLPDGRRYRMLPTFAGPRGPIFADDNNQEVNPALEAHGAATTSLLGRAYLAAWLMGVAIGLGGAIIEGAAGEAIIAGEAAGGGSTAAGGAAASPYAGMTNAQIARQLIGSEQTALLREFFGTSMRGAAAREAAFEVPAGLTRASLDAYAEIARRTIAAGADTLGVQATRLRLIERALQLLPK